MRRKKCVVWTEKTQILPSSILRTIFERGRREEEEEGPFQNRGHPREEERVGRARVFALRFLAVLSGGAGGRAQKRAGKAFGQSALQSPVTAIANVM